MAFMILCMACKKQVEAGLDTQKNVVYCNDCGNEIPNVSHFVKVQMKTLGQTKKPQKKAYSVRCEKCKQEALPKLNNNILVCANCNFILKNISAPFAILIRKAIAEGDRDL